MSETVAEFIEKPYQKYPCGRAAQKAKKSLIKAFTASSERAFFKEEALFEQIIDSVMLTKKGKETMTALSKLGYSFAFEKGKFGGYCNADQKKIVLNPSFGLEYMMQSAVHEGRHAIQHSLEKENCPALEHTQVAAALRMRRAIEADAVAHEMAFVYETKNVLPEVYKKAEEYNFPMFRAYVSEMDTSGDERKAMQASFKAWYECDYYRNYYDNQHKKNIEQIAAFGKNEQDSACFSKDYPVEDIFKMCRYKGQSYMDAAFLNGDRAFSIKEKDKPEICAFMDSYAKAVPGAKSDKSVLTMCSRNEAGDLIAGSRGVSAALVAKTVSRKDR